MATGASKKMGSGRHVSAIKRSRQNKKRRFRNKGTKSALRTAVKNFTTERTAENLKKTVSVIDRTASKGVIPRRRASRMISRLTKSMNASA
jgi:small subunit ribosomal protein S20